MQVFSTRLDYACLMANGDPAKGKHLKMLREAAGLSIRELARQIDQDHSNIRYWETSGNLPRSDVLIPMAKALGVTVDELLGEQKPKRSSAPAGKMRQLFEAASKLPRSKQKFVVEFLESYLERTDKAA